MKIFSIRMNKKLTAYIEIENNESFSYIDKSGVDFNLD
jgi:hypothetical protein